MKTHDAGGPERVCDACGYSLAGLPKGTACPECGAASRAEVRALHDATMSVEAPAWFVKKLRLGALLCMASILGVAGSLVALVVGGFLNIGGLLGVLIFIVFVVVAVASPILWPIGVWMLSSPRRGIGEVTRDGVLDNDALRNATRGLACAFPAAIGLAVLANATGVTSPIVHGFIELVWIAGWIGLVPLSVYLSAVAYWATDHGAANSLQGTAWIMCASGTLVALFEILGRTSLPISAAAPFISIFLYAILVIAIGFLFYRIMGLGSSISWVLANQQARAGSAERVRRKIEDRTGAPNRVADMTCNECGYDLSGLPLGGACPECGESYADRTNRPIRDPALDRPRHDSSDIPIEGLEFDPDTDAPAPRTPEPMRAEMEIPDEGDIPLADDDDAGAADEGGDDGDRAGDDDDGGDDDDAPREGGGGTISR